MMWRWPPCLCFFVFLCLIRNSQEGCKDYLNMREWMNSTALKNVSLVITENTANVAECTLESYCLQGQICDVLNDCFDRHAESQSAKCKPVLNVTVHPHHLMCLLARVIDSQNSVFGCEYATVCPLFEERYQAVTAPDTTTVRSTTMTSTFASSSTVQLPNSHVSLPKCITVAGNGQYAQNISCESKEMSYLKALIGILSTLVIVLPFAVYFYMQRTFRANQQQMENIGVST
ncbi:uncharacterized protein [Syngnathus scovelli]|uniref:uncharacterized protein isoform X2 n=1 Tax=Syngnathus scovelli TaxID=161590 RepID=UPI002110A5B9|nr:PIH1 domain-containing protein 1 isoform X3 [Syngnathus scovelli]